MNNNEIRWFYPCVGETEKLAARAVTQKWIFHMKLLENLLMSMKIPKSFIIKLRILINYPKRVFSYAPKATFDSFEKNFVKQARKWAKKTPPFYSNGQDWGLAKESLIETQLEL